MEKPAELFFERQRRIEKELAEMIRVVGERDVEIARLRETLSEIVVECDQTVQCKSIKQVRTRALRAMGVQRDQNEN